MRLYAFPIDYYLSPRDSNLHGKPKYCDSVRLTFEVLDLDEIAGVWRPNAELLLEAQREKYEISADDEDALLAKFENTCVLRFKSNETAEVLMSAAAACQLIWGVKLDEIAGYAEVKKLIDAQNDDAE